MPQIDPGVAIGVTGLLIAIIQIYIGHKRQISLNTFQIFELLHKPEFQVARFKVRHLLESCKQEKDGGILFNFDTLTSEEHAELSRTGSVFGYLGILYKKGLVDRQLVLETWAHSILLNYQRLKPYTDYRQSDKGRLGRALSGFEYIADASKRYLKSAEKHMQQ